MYHQILVVGRLGRDPEMRYTQGGTPVTSFSIATSRKYNKGDGQLVEETIWIRVSVFGKQAESSAQYLKKGSAVLVEGRLSPDPQTGNPKTFQRQDGTVGTSYEVVANTVRFLTPKGELFAVLVRYRDDGHAEDLTSWFAHYNARQIIEAGISEGKGVLTLRKPLVRSPAGLALQLHFALFAANFIRWAAQWMDTLIRQANRFFENALRQVSTLVKVGTRTAARWVRVAGNRALIWPDHGPLAGTVLAFSGQLASQLALPLFNFLGSSPKPHLSATVAQPLG